MPWSLNRAILWNVESSQTSQSIAWWKGASEMPEQSVNPVGTEPSSQVLVGRGVKLLGEMVVGPGASLALDGKILPGAAHFVGGMLARWAFGPVGWFLVAANS